MERNIHSDKADISLQTETGYEILKLYSLNRAILLAADDYFHHDEAPRLHHASFVMRPFIRADNGDVAVNVVRRSTGQPLPDETVNFAFVGDEQSGYSLSPIDLLPAMEKLGQPSPYSDMVIDAWEVECFKNIARAFAVYGLSPN